MIEPINVLEWKADQPKPITTTLLEPHLLATDKLRSQFIFYVTITPTLQQYWYSCRMLSYIILSTLE